MSAKKTNRFGSANLMPRDFLYNESCLYDEIELSSTLVESMLTVAVVNPFIFSARLSLNMRKRAADDADHRRSGTNQRSTNVHTENLTPTSLQVSIRISPERFLHHV